MNLLRLIVGTLLAMLAAILFTPANFFGVFSSSYTAAWLWLGGSGIIAIGIGDYFSYRMYTVPGARNIDVAQTIFSLVPALAIIIAHFCLQG
ncbi:MAG: hypothetical protein H7258_06970 [Ferruginibacter sp.]|nr:hypothetical protein [Ferruginibacter sp.]